MQLTAHIFEQTLAVLNFLFMTWEGVSFILSLIYVMLSISKKKSSWLFSILAAASYGYVCWDAQLYPTLGLQAFFIILSIYGYYQWQKNEKNQIAEKKTHLNSNSVQLVAQISPIQHLLAIAVCFILFDVIRYLFLKMGMPFQSKIEIFAVAASLVAQYLQAKSYQENWVWWFLINILYVWINLKTNLNLIALLYAILVVLSAQGWHTWRQKSKKYSLEFPVADLSNSLSQDLSAVNAINPPKPFNTK
jgi:nicotinamide mononucleotide transporter